MRDKISSLSLICSHYRGMRILIFFKILDFDISWILSDILACFQVLEFVHGWIFLWTNFDSIPELCFNLLWNVSGMDTFWFKRKF